MTGFPVSGHDRRNMVSDEGVSYYVRSNERDDTIAGPFGTKAYAMIVRERLRDRYDGRLSVTGRSVENAGGTA